MDAVLPKNLSIERTSTVDQVADRLRQMIWSGELAPNLRLREVQLAQSFGVSRNTIRDAIRLLTTQGLVRHVLHHGAVVASLSPEDIAGLYQVRRVLELEAVMAKKPPSDRREAVLAAAESMEEAARQRDWQTLTEFDMRFHAAIVGLLDSERIDRFFEQIGSESRLAIGILTFEDERATGKADPADAYKSLAEFEDPRKIAADHRAIYDELAAGRRREARKLLRDHLARNQKRLVGIVRARTGDGKPA